MFESEWTRMRNNLTRLTHDHLFANPNLDVPDAEWTRTHDSLNKRIGGYRVSNDESLNFKVYVKGLVSVKLSLAGVGVAVYDGRDRCVFELRKRFNSVGLVGGDEVEMRALVEGVHAAVKFGLKRVNVYCDCESVHQFLTGKDKPTNKLTLKLVDALILIMRKIGYRGPFLMRQSSMKSAYKLAKTAITSQATKYAESAFKQCTVCLEHISKDSMFSHNKCPHEYCYSCMNKYVESKLFQGQMPDCPHEKCTSQLDIKDCKNFLKKNLYDIMNSRITEAAIPPTERVYCPFVKCSVLMSKIELQYAGSTLFQEFGKRKCSKCQGVFCMNCKVPWHDGYRCSDYIKCSSDQFVDEVILKSLATRNSWRQCVKCMHMIELAAGCHHISCRCGYEFCYKCGGEYINKKATCACPLWELDNILYVE